MSLTEQFKKEKKRAWIIELIILCLMYATAKIASAEIISIVAAVLLLVPQIVIIVYFEEKLEKYCKTGIRTRLLNSICVLIALSVALFSSLSFRLEIMIAIFIVYINALNIYQYKACLAKITEQESAAADNKAEL